MSDHTPLIHPETQKVSLFIEGFQHGFGSLRDIDLRITPSASWTIDKPVYKVNWGIKHRNGNRVFGTLNEDIYYDNTENLFALLHAALEALKRDDKFGHNTWTPSLAEIEASSDPFYQRESGGYDDLRQS